MPDTKKRWYYWNYVAQSWDGPLTLAELDGLHTDGKIKDFTHCTNTALMSRDDPSGHQGIAYSSISRIDVEFVPNVEELHAERADRPTTILSGPNNGGKTLLLKQLFYLVGHEGHLVACNRFSHVDTLNTRPQDKYEYRRYYDDFVQTFHTSHQNKEDNVLKLEQVITSLKDMQRDKLFDVAGDLLGNKFSLKRTNPENTFSPFYVDMDGENLRYGSSGTRLLLTILGFLLDERFSVILIDEPEIGLSPRIQAVLARFLYNLERRRQFYPHLKQIFIATHSHLFLDRQVFSNNHVVTKVGSVVTVKRVQSVGDLHQLQFNMLGNDLESIFLPSAIVIVEGESDVTFMTKVAHLHVPNRKVAVIRAGGDGEVQNKLNILKEAFGDMAASPYRDRLFVVLDSRHSVSTARLERQGVPGQNITVWSKNGIEHYYPKELLAEAFHCDLKELASANIESDPIEVNGIRMSKKELAQFIARRLEATHILEQELASLVRDIRVACR